MVCKRTMNMDLSVAAGRAWSARLAGPALARPGGRWYPDRRMAVPDNTRPLAALPPGTRLDEFELRRVLGIGGFGIVYLAFDHALEREVAIKEYMPASLVGRSSDGRNLSLLDDAQAGSFARGLRSFVNEARLLARFDAPGLVKVHRFWEANNTAYMAMPYYTGSNLHAVRRRMDSPPAEAWLRTILQPLLDALERLHREGIYHRDISPDNVILQPDGQPVLLDFGAARRVIGDKSVALTAILKPAYAPVEQYAEPGAVKQGAWTDLYALGATLHFLLLGHAPPPATGRAMVDSMPPLAGQQVLLARCTPGFLQAVDWMLRPRPADRPQSVAALRAALLPRDDPLAERTILDLSHRPPAQRADSQRDDEATVLLPRRDEPTVLMPRRPAAVAPAPVRDEPTILMPRRASAPAAAPLRPDEVNLLLPLDGTAPASAPARPAFDDTHEPTLRMPPPGTAKAAPARQPPGRQMPMPKPVRARRWLPVAAVVLALAAVALAAWLVLRPAAKAPVATSTPPPPAESTK
jgi:serine/threonine protein kinase